MPARDGWLGARLLKRFVITLEMIKIEHTIFALLFWREGLGGISLTGLGLVAILLAYEYSLVCPSDLSRANAAFFTVNGWISVLLLVTTSLDLLWGRFR